MGLSIKKGKGVQSDINITPLIDVVLVLLIIFMVLTPIMIREMAVNLPEKTETVDQKDLPKDQLVAAACLDGTYTLNRKVLSLADLHDQVRRRLKSRSNKAVFIDAHPDVAYENVVTLMDTVRDAGADRVGLGNIKDLDEFRACTPPEAGAPDALPDDAG